MRKTENRPAETQQESTRVRDELSVREVAQLVGVSSAVVRRAIKAGRRAWEIGRSHMIHRQDAAAWAAERGQRRTSGA